MQIARLGAKTEAIGFTNITRYLVQHGARTAAPNGAQTEAAGFKALTRYKVEHAAETPLPTSTTRFAWGAALISSRPEAENATSLPLAGGARELPVGRPKITGRPASSRTRVPQPARSLSRPYGSGGHVSVTR